MVSIWSIAVIGLPLLRPISNQPLVMQFGLGYFIGAFMILPSMFVAFLIRYRREISFRFRVGLVSFLIAAGIFGFLQFTSVMMSFS